MRSRGRILILALLAGALVLGGTGGHDATTLLGGQPAVGEAESSDPRVPSDATGPVPDLERVSIQLTEVAELPGGPTALALRAGDDRLYVATKEGRVWRVEPEGARRVTLLDLRDEVRSEGGEQGLLGMAFSPDGGTLYVNLTDLEGDTRILALPFREGGMRAQDALDVLRVAQPFATHNGGGMAFGPDGYLWVSVGDGGIEQVARVNAQRLDVLLGKLLRIDPRPGSARGYVVPLDNPFVGRDGRDEIWASGLRNPFRFSFDRATGDLWVVDVGGGSFEEINLERVPLRGGQNYGWPWLEGLHLRERRWVPRGYVAPVYEYAHEGHACTVTGGYVYRGSAIPELRGAYVFADYCTGILQALSVADGRTHVHRSFGRGRPPALTSFGQDGAGELYALFQGGKVFRIDPARRRSLSASPGPR